MTLDDLVSALGLPEAARVNRRVPKKLLAEQEAATAADRRQIQDGVDEIFWLAALKPHLIGVPAFEDAQRKYVELAVLHVSLKAGTKPGRLVELMHRAVPYPMLLLSTSNAGFGVSLAHLRTSQNEADKVVLDGDLLTVTLPLHVSSGQSPERAQDIVAAGFLAALDLARQPQADMYALYQGWMDTVGALDIAFETGRYQPSSTLAQAAERHQALQQCRQLQTKLAELRAHAQKESQIARQVALNLKIKQLASSIESMRKVLASGNPT
ncbi:MAG: DUF4391 domain-containing protein [Variovorax sp.]